MRKEDLEITCPRGFKSLTTCNKILFLFTQRDEPLAQYCIYFHSLHTHQAGKFIEINVPTPKIYPLPTVERLHLLSLDNGQLCHPNSICVSRGQLPKNTSPPPPNPPKPVTSLQILMFQVSHIKLSDRVEPATVDWITLL